MRGGLKIECMDSGTTVKTKYVDGAWFSIRMTPEDEAACGWLPFTEQIKHKIMNYNGSSHFWLGVSQ